MARVLIVEDNELNRILARELVAADGHSVTEATTADEALALVRPGAFDVVLLDVQIPGGGHSVLWTLRADPLLAPLPVVAVTAFAMSGDRERLLEAGFDDYVSKPIAPDRLSAAIADALARTGSPSSGSASSGS